MPSNSATLPIETFEQFMLAGDSPEFPMSFVFEFTLDGQLDLARLNEAIRCCATQHPLLFSTIDSTKKNWSFNPDWVRPAEPANTASHAQLRFDLARENGLRVVFSKPDGTTQRIRFVFHHACVDGLGALQFLKDVASACGSETGTSSVFEPPPEQAIQYLRRYRNSSGGNRFLHFLRWPIDGLGMLWSLEMVLNRPKPIEPETGTGTDEKSTQHDSTRPSSCSTANVVRILTPEQSVLAKQRSKATGQTLNDRVMESFFLAIEEWNGRFNPANSGSLVRILVPMSLRRAPSKSAANLVAMVNFDRKTGLWKSRSRFRKILALEMRVVKRIRAGVTANRYLKLQKLFLGHWPMQSDRKRCYASCIVSNLGELSSAMGGKPGELVRFGQTPVSRFQVIAPLRRNSNVFICLFSHLEQLNLNMTYNSGILNKVHAEYLLDCAVRHLFDEQT